MRNERKNISPPEYSVQTLIRENEKEADMMKDGLIFPGLEPDRLTSLIPEVVDNGDNYEIGV
jgi:hypothetical protein